MSDINIGMLFVFLIIFVIFYLLFKLIGGGATDIWTIKKDMEREPKEKKIIFNEDTVLIGDKKSKNFSLPAKMSHVFICGTTGSGKTVAISNFIKCAIDNEYPLLLVDGKGDEGNDSILEIVKMMKKDRKLYVINMNDPKNSDKYNPFKDTKPTIIKDMLISLTVWSEEHYKLNTERYLQRVISAMEMCEIPFSFETIIHYLTGDNFLVLSSKLVKENTITKEKHIENADLVKSTKTIIEGAIARFATIFENEIGDLFSSEGIDIFSALKEKAIILFILNPLIYPELSTLFGKLTIIDSKKAVAKLYKEKLGRTFFIFDEINVYASKQFLDLVNKSRSADVTSILACQSLSDLDANESADFKEQVIENTNTHIVLRQNSNKNATEWADIIGTRETVNVTYQLSNENGVVSDTGKGSATKGRKYIMHPDDIKNLPMGNAFVVSKDYKIKKKLKINKPF